MPEPIADRTVDSPDRPDRVLVVDPIAAGALAELRTHYDVTVAMQPGPAELERLLQDTDAIVLRSGVRLPAAAIEGAPRLRVIARAGNGTENIDLDAARRTGVQVFNIPSVSSGAVAELALGVTLAITRKICQADREVRQNIWRKADLVGAELSGKTMGIVGLGSIGGRLARIAQALDMDVVGSVRNHTAERSAEWRERGVDLVPVPEVLRRADVVVLACPLDDATRNLVAAPELQAMKPSAYLVNVARGGVVDEDALYTALVEGWIAGAALDVLATERAATPLAALDNVVLTPHIGAMSWDSQDRIGELLLDGLRCGLAGQDAPTRVC